MHRSIERVRGCRGLELRRQPQEQVLRALEAGANEYLMKPFTREVLIAKLSLLDIDYHGGAGGAA